MTGHQDIPATLLSFLGVENDPADYSHGRSMFSQQRRPYVVGCGWNQSAIVDENGWLLFGTRSNNPWEFDLRDSNYERVTDVRGTLSKRAGDISGTIQLMNAFLH